MHNSYSDIVDRIKEQPIWWDNNGVPRYEKFRPYLMPDIYADEAVLYLIECQGCGTEFQVAETHSFKDIMRAMRGVCSHLSEEEQKELIRKQSEASTLASQIKSGYLHYGDPPNTGCCGAGSTMNCMDIKVLEYWKKANFEWVRDSQLEIDLSDADWNNG